MRWSWERWGGWGGWTGNLGLFIETAMRTFKTELPYGVTIHISVTHICGMLLFELLTSLYSCATSPQASSVNLMGATLTEPGWEESSPQDNDVERSPVCLLKN